MREMLVFLHCIISGIPFWWYILFTAGKAISPVEWSLEIFLEKVAFLNGHVPGVPERDGDI